MYMCMYLLNKDSMVFLTEPVVHKELQSLRYNRKNHACMYVYVYVFIEQGLYGVLDWACGAQGAAISEI
jgi:hypothetical protein